MLSWCSENLTLNRSRGSEFLLLFLRYFCLLKKTFKHRDGYFSVYRLSRLTLTKRYTVWSVNSGESSAKFGLGYLGALAIYFRPLIGDGCSLFAITICGNTLFSFIESLRLHIVFQCFSIKLFLIRRSHDKFNYITNGFMYWGYIAVAAKIYFKV